MGKKDKKKDKKKESQQANGGKALQGRPRFANGRTAGRPKPMKPADIRALRESLNASQALLARLLNVSSNAVESWEQGIREPRQATLKLLHIAKKNPSVLLD